MRESLEDAREELKRIDHLIYVTLKYTRTVDVLVSILERMINSYEYAIITLLKYAKENKMIDEIPEIPMIMAKKVKATFKQKIMAENMDEFLLYRKLVRSNYERSNEYRRHVTMSCIIDNEIVAINIDNITEKFHSLKKFIHHVTKMILEGEK